MRARVGLATTAQPTLLVSFLKSSYLVVVSACPLSVPMGRLDHVGRPAHSLLYRVSSAVGDARYLM